MTKGTESGQYVPAIELVPGDFVFVVDVEAKCRIKSITNGMISGHLHIEFSPQKDIKIPITFSEIPKHQLVFRETR